MAHTALIGGVFQLLGPPVSQINSPNVTQHSQICLYCGLPTSTLPAPTGNSTVWLLRPLKDQNNTGDLEPVLAFPTRPYSSTPTGEA